MAKIFSALTLVVAAIAIFLGLQSKDRIEKIKASAEAEHTDLIKTKDDLKKTKDTLQATTDELTTTKTDLEKEKETRRMVEADLVKAKTDLETATMDLTQTKTKLAEVEKQLVELMGQKPGEDPKAQIAAMVAKVTDLEGKVQTLEKEKAELSTTVETLQVQKKDADEKVAAQTTVIDRYQKNIMVKGVRGRVLAVNAGWGFCVLSIGDRQGAASNKILIVARGGQSIGKVKITNVEASQSVADIIPSSFVRGTYVEPGDEVIFTGDDKVREEPAEVAENSAAPGGSTGTLPLPR